MQSQQLVLALIVMLSLSCRKITHNTDVSGSVYDANTFAAIPGAKVAVLKAKSGCFTCPGTVVGETTTDSDGKYELEFKSEKEYTYSMAAAKDNYFEELGGNIYVDKDKRNKKVAIPLRSQAYLKLYVKNTQPFNVDDLIEVNYTTSPEMFYGMNVDTFLVAIVHGNRENTISWGVRKSNIITNHIEYVFCPAFDTTTYTINY